MQIKILGCSGGIGDSLRTTSMLVDDDILIDAGTGVGDLSMEALLKIDHIFITHTHLDHIAFIPLLLDTVMGFREKPVIVYATAENLTVLREHIFNWKIWPDFNQIPDAANPLLQYEAIDLGKPISLNGRTITALPANHVVPAVGYHVQHGDASLVFTGDTTESDALWQAVNTIKHLKYLIIETAFSNSEYALAKLSKHLCPSMLVTELAKLDVSDHAQPIVYITHLKPGEAEKIMQEIGESHIPFATHALQAQQVFNL